MKHRTILDPHLGRAFDISPMLETILLVLLGALALGYAGVMGWQLSLGKLPFQAMTYTFSALVLVHAIYMEGWRRALAFFALTLIISFVMEYLGVKTGRIFGPYHYTDVLDPKLLGTVPLVIPLAYFMVLHPSRMMADLIQWGQATDANRGLGWSLFTAALAALIMTAWDLSMDPVMVHEVKAWVWEGGGAYFGVPLRNFWGWFLTTALIALAAEATEHVLPLRPLGRMHKSVIFLPLAGYGLLMLGGPLVGVPTDTRLVSPFTMAVPLLGASLRLWGRRAPARRG
nr:carotenoid biosynthesis protein [uncultured Holophaga sp.]